MTFLSQNAYRKSRTAGAIKASFELFPARSDADLRRMKKLAKPLGLCSPTFVSVTYGAGGSTRDATLQTIETLRSSTDWQIAGHLTCVGAAREDTDAVARRYAELGINRIVALRGDAPAGTPRYEPHPQGYTSTAALVEALKSAGDFDISVAAYPEVHPDSACAKADIDNLRDKLSAGADRAITQFFFDNRDYYRFLDSCEASGIDKPIVPGILLIHDFRKVCNFAARCKAQVPDWLRARFAGIEDDPLAHKLMAASVATEQVLDLVSQGITQFHFYTLNKADLATSVCRCLGIMPNEHLSAAA